MQITKTQDTFLNQIRKKQVSVTVYMVNGFQIKGTIQAFDSFTIVINSGNKQQLLFKHAISTIIPEQAVDLQAKVEQ